MVRVNRWHAPRWIRAWMLLASRGGDGWLWFFLGLALALFAPGDGFRIVTVGFASWLSGVAVFKSIKLLGRRERPCAIEPHCWAGISPPRDRFSFPSGHTISAFAIALPWGAYYPHLMAGLLFIAFSIAASRVVLGLHYLSDVLAGIAIGTAIGALASHWAV
jgi:undecaprenyl-diphosphatase